MSGNRWAPISATAFIPLGVGLVLGVVATLMVQSRQTPDVAIPSEVSTATAVSSVAYPTPRFKIAQIRAEISRKLLDSEYNGTKRVRPLIGFEMKITNLDTRDIRAITGVLYLQDRRDTRLIYEQETTLDVGIRAGTSNLWATQWEGYPIETASGEGLEIQRRSPETYDQARLREITTSELQVILMVREVLFADGSREGYP